MQLLRNRGNHVVLLRVKIPVQLSDKQRRIFEELAREEEPQAEGEGVFERMKKAFR